MNLLEYPTTGPGTDTGLETKNNSNSNNDASKHRALCLLSLDGGGVRGLSTLFILRGIMNRLNDTREEQGLGRVKRCEVFDLIGGTSTGGYVPVSCIPTSNLQDLSADAKIKAHRHHAWPVGDDRRRLHHRVQGTHADRLCQEGGLKSNTSFTEHDDQPSILL